MLSFHGLPVSEKSLVVFTIPSAVILFIGHSILLFSFCPVVNTFLLASVTYIYIYLIVWLSIFRRIFISLFAFYCVGTSFSGGVCIIGLTTDFFILPFNSFPIFLFLHIISFRYSAALFTLFTWSCASFSKFP